MFVRPCSPPPVEITTSFFSFYLRPPLAVLMTLPLFLSAWAESPVPVTFVFIRLYLGDRFSL